MSTSRGINFKFIMEAIQYRSVIRYLVLKQKTAVEIFEDLKKTYGNDAPGHTTVKYWVREFKTGRTTVVDDERPGRPQEIPDSISDSLSQIVQDERRIGIKSLSKRLNISKGTVDTIMQNLGIRKLASRFVPSFLTGDMMEKRLDCCQENLQIWQEFGDTFLANIVTQDETPLSLYIPESKRSSSEWKLPSERASRKLRSGTSHRRSMMLSVFWDHQGILLIDFADKTVKLNAAYYSKLLENVRSRRRKSRNTPIWYLHDNAPIHTAEVSKSTIDKCSFTALRHPPYSPDLAPSDFWMFRHLKKHLAGQMFQNKDDLKLAVEDFFENCGPDFFKKPFDDLVVRWKKCVDNFGGYIEK